MIQPDRPPAPPPPAQIAPFVQVLGLENAVRFILAFGGAELAISQNPRDGTELVRLFGPDAAARLGALDNRPRRIPLAKPWLAAHFHAQGLSVAQIARKLRVSDISVRAYLKRAAANRERLAEDARRLAARKP